MFVDELLFLVAEAVDVNVDVDVVVEVVVVVAEAVNVDVVEVVDDVIVSKSVSPPPSSLPPLPSEQPQSGK